MQFDAKFRQVKHYEEQKTHMRGSVVGPYPAKQLVSQVVPLSIYPVLQDEQAVLSVLVQHAQKL